MERPRWRWLRPRRRCTRRGPSGWMRRGRRPRRRGATVRVACRRGVRAPPTGRPRRRYPRSACRSACRGAVRARRPRRRVARRRCPAGRRSAGSAHRSPAPASTRARCCASAPSSPVGLGIATMPVMRSRKRVSSTSAHAFSTQACCSALSASGSTVSVSGTTRTPPRSAQGARSRPRAPASRPAQRSAIVVARAMVAHSCPRRSWVAHSTRADHGGIPAVADRRERMPLPARLVAHAEQLREAAGPRSPSPRSVNPTQI